MDQPAAMSATDRIAVVIAKILVFFRWPVVILGIASVVAAGYGGQYLGFSNNYRYFFAPENRSIRRSPNSKTSTRNATTSPSC